jgi:hypothetical protein
MQYCGDEKGEKKSYICKLMLLEMEKFNDKFAVKFGKNTPKCFLIFPHCCKKKSNKYSEKDSNENCFPSK